jgi:hypothetical protein
MDFQFSLRSLLLITLIVAIFSAVVPPFLPYSALYFLLLVSGAVPFIVVLVAGESVEPDPPEDHLPR